MTSELIILRHGLSEWNALNLFTGWVDVDLSELGEQEAKRAGSVMFDVGFVPDVVFTSVLKRAVRTADLAPEAMGVNNCETHRSWRLNERHYGALTGLDKKETVKQYGEDQVQLWRRSYDVPPPPLSDGGKYDFVHDPLYIDVSCQNIPVTECLKDVRERVTPYFEEKIIPRLINGDNVLIVAHGNSLRAVIMMLENLTPEEIVSFELPTATPRRYRFDGAFTVSEGAYLEDDDIVADRASSVKNQTASK